MTNAQEITKKNLNENQLSWLRSHMPGFALHERMARSKIDSEVEYRKLLSNKLLPELREAN